jgi:NAD(P)H-dependent FMN reductase
VKAIIISGTNRSNSASLAVSKHLHQLYSSSIDCEILSLCDLPHDLLSDNFYSQRHPEILAIVERIKATDLILFVIPEYHGSFSGIAKFFLDLMPSSVFKNKKVGIIGVSDGHAGNMRGIDHFTAVMHYLRASVISFFPKISHVNLMIHDGAFSPDERVKGLFSELAGEIQIT